MSMPAVVRRQIISLVSLVLGIGLLPMLAAAQTAPKEDIVTALVKKAAAAGVKESDITRAILEGRFVPLWSELHDVAISLGRDSSIMTEEWNRRFGSIAAIDRVRTFHNGEWMELTGKDLTYLLFMDTSYGLLLNQSTRLDPGRQVTYAAAEAFLGQNRRALKEVDRWAETRNPSLWDYFNNGSYTTFTDRRGDYDGLLDTSLVASATARGVAPVRVGGAVKEPVKLKDVLPVYPDLARRARIQGRWILDVVVGPDGRVRSVTPRVFVDLVSGRATSGGPLLEGAALDAVRQWVYQPTMINGQAVSINMQVDVTFSLR